MQTIRCLESLRLSEIQPDRIFVLDNSEIDDGLENALVNCEPFESSELIFIKSPKNLGFAEGSNVLIEEALKHTDCKYLLLLNNDAIAMLRLISELKAALAAQPSAGMAGPRVHKLENPNEIDSLGIVLYRSLMPADRYDINEPYLGPSGGCAMITRECLAALKENAGYFFDPRFFCYCEDTDLALRANLLGYTPRFVDEVLALHEGQASSAKGFNRFIAYHGLRNATWVTVKLIPTTIFTRFFLAFLLAHILWFSNHLFFGRFELVFRTYFDTAKEIREVIFDRKKLSSNFQKKDIDFSRLIAKRFYRKGYLTASAITLTSFTCFPRDANNTRQRRL
jgi:GT2 family glycosyltransferase